MRLIRGGWLCRKLTGVAEIITNDEKECVCVERNTRNLGPKRGHRDHVGLHWYDTCEQERDGGKEKEKEGAVSPAYSLSDGLCLRRLLISHMAHERCLSRLLRIRKAQLGHGRMHR